MNVLFTSDLHLGHKLASDKRGFDSVYEHDEHIIECLNEYCSKRTVLWILGDAAFSSEALIQLHRVNGRLKLVRGNHDQCGMDEYNQVFEEVHGFLKYKNMWLSHCPVHPQEMFRCDVNVHGHIHKDAATKPLGYPYINVNWDFWDRPLGLQEIRKLIDLKSDGLTNLENEE